MGRGAGEGGRGRKGRTDAGEVKGAGAAVAAQQVAATTAFAAVIVVGVLAARRAAAVIRRVCTRTPPPFAVTHGLPALRQGILNNNI